MIRRPSRKPFKVTSPESAPQQDRAPRTTEDGLIMTATARAALNRTPEETIEYDRKREKHLRNAR